MRVSPLTFLSALALTGCSGDGGSGPSPIIVDAGCLTDCRDGGGGQDAAPPDHDGGAQDGGRQDAAPRDDDAGPDAAPPDHDGGCRTDCQDGGGDQDAAPPPSDAAAPDADTGEQPVPPLTGCQPERPAVAFHPGAGQLDPQPARAPFPCAAPTNQKAPFNTSLAVTDEGHVLFAPASSTGVIRSLDHGATFEGPLNDPPAEDAGLWGHPYLTRDPDTGRLFYTLYNSFLGPCALGTGHNYWYSDDDGATWVEVPEGVGCGSWDWGKIITGPAATAANRAALAESGYPNLVYFCAGGMVYALGTHHYCYRSTDGGKTFKRTKGDAVDPARGQAGWPNAGAIAPDGTFYKVHGSPQGVVLEISEDDGDSWRAVNVPNSALGLTPSINFLASNVATDSAGNVYVVWSDDRDLLPYLSVSRDRGESWSEPMMVGAPGVRASTNVNVSTREPGYVAVAYYGSEQKDGVADGYFDHDGRPYNAYIVATRDVFQERPVFWGASVNDPSEPTLPDGINLLVSEYIGAPVFGPDGSIWAGFLRNDQGLVGRLSPPPR